MNFFVQSLTFFRILAAPALFILISYFNFYGVAVILFVLASSSDYWDGYLARKYHLESELGAVLDPIADKILITFLILALTIELNSIFIGFVGGVVLVREFWVGALRDFNARQNNQDATNVTKIAKIKTAIQLLTFTSFLLRLFLSNALVLFIPNFFLFLALIITIQTGLSYTIATFRK